MRKKLQQGWEEREEASYSQELYPGLGAQEMTELLFWDLQNSVQHVNILNKSFLDGQKIIKNSPANSSSSDPIPDSLTQTFPFLLGSSMCGNQSYRSRLLGVTLLGFIMSCEGWFGHFALSAKVHSWKMGIFWAPRTHFFFFAASQSLLHFHSVSRGPFHKELGQAAAICSPWHTASGEEQTKPFISYPEKNSNHKNNSAFCQHWLLAARRLFYSRNS